MGILGFTSSIPVEVVYAAGHVPVDLNNLFVNDPDPMRFIQRAEQDGFPRTTCAWVKGLYGVAMDRHPKNLDAVIAVVEGDCSANIALMEVLEHCRIPTIPFAYPYPGPESKKRMTEILDNFAAGLGTDMKKSEQIKAELDEIRKDLIEYDRRTWSEGAVSGEENFDLLVRASDFDGDPANYHKEVKALLRESAKRKPQTQSGLRLGVCGVPPIVQDLYPALEKLGVDVVFNEIPRQFAMPDLLPNLAAQYLAFTYPYDLTFRIRDILREIKRRRIDGLIHYAQTFCHLNIGDRILRDRARLPVLTFEGDLPGPIDARTMMRLETFVDVLKN